jgi:hypothetical protein
VASIVNVGSTLNPCVDPSATFHSQNSRGGCIQTPATTLAVMLGNKRQLGQVLCRSEQASLNRGRTTARRRVSATRNGFHLSVSPSNPMAGPRSPSNGFIVEEHASRAHLRVPIKDKLLKG